MICMCMRNKSQVTTYLSTGIKRYFFATDRDNNTTFRKHNMGWHFGSCISNYNLYLNIKLCVYKIGIGLSKLSLLNLGILISGRGSNMESILTAIESGKIKNVKPSVVISNRPNAAGLIIALERFKVPSIVVSNNGTKGWNYDKRIVSVLHQYGVTPKSGLICLAGFMRIISAEFVKIGRAHV